MEWKRNFAKSSCLSNDAIFQERKKGGKWKQHFLHKVSPAFKEGLQTHNRPRSNSPYLLRIEYNLPRHTHAIIKQLFSFLIAYNKRYIFCLITSFMRLCGFSTQLNYQELWILSVINCSTRWITTYVSIEVKIKALMNLTIVTGWDILRIMREQMTNAWKSNGFGGL